MGTSVSTLITDVQFRLVRDDVSNAHIIRRINWAVQDIGSRFMVPELEQQTTFTASATAGIKGRILLSSTTNKLRWILTVSNTQNMNNLIMASPVMAAGFNEAITGTPTYWYHFGNYCYTYPIDTTHKYFNIRYRSYPSSITGTSSTNDLPTYLDRAITLGACYMILSDLNENENAGIAYQQYAEQLKNMKPYQAEEFATSRQGVQVQG